MHAPKNTLHVLDLFSGIGGFSLGLERAGMRTVAFCEIDPYCQRVLRRHWPGVPIWPDIRTLRATDLLAIDLICGGFPCTDISVAGKGLGITGPQSGLWSEYARIIGEVRPRYVIVENVAALLGRGIERVLGDLAALGYDAEWHCIPASAVGAPHRRDRVWIVAYAALLHSDGGGNHARGNSQSTDAVSKSGNGFGHADVANAAQQCINGTGATGPRRRHEHSNGSGDVADADQPRLQGWLGAELRQCADKRIAWANGAYAQNDATNGDGIGRNNPAGQWRTEPNVGRVAHGVPARVDRLRALGNAVVPQIPEIIGRAILNAHTVGPPAELRSRL